MGIGKIPRQIHSQLSQSEIYPLVFFGHLKVASAYEEHRTNKESLTLEKLCSGHAVNSLHRNFTRFFVGADVLNVPAYEEHRPKIKGAFVPGSRLARAQFVLPNRFVSFKRSPALESCSAC